MISRERLGRPGWKILGLLFLVAVIMAAAWGARAAAREMAFFRVRAVEVRGVRYLQPNDIISRLKIDTVASLWDDLEPYRQRIRQHPQVSDVHITRRMPGTLVVTIEERVPTPFFLSGSEPSTRRSRGCSRESKR
jgi:cell division septal protein FtsQ